MSTTPSNDTCPNCGTTVTADSSRGIGARGEGEALPEPNEQSRRCPACGKLLRRAVGSPWKVNETADA
jgi:hypothetical protein